MRSSRSWVKMAAAFLVVQGSICVQFRFPLLVVDHGSYSYEGNAQRYV
jgi:hypothetical protein